MEDVFDAFESGALITCFCRDECSGFLRLTGIAIETSLGLIRIRLNRRIVERLFVSASCGGGLAIVRCRLIEVRFADLCGEII